MTRLETGVRAHLQGDAPALFNAAGAERDDRQALRRMMFIKPLRRVTDDGWSSSDASIPQLRAIAGH